MDLGYPVRPVSEGRVHLFVPDVPTPRGPGTRSALPFYNPSMTVARDVSVLVAGAVLPEGGTALDGLAASGVLGLRIAAESGRVPAVTLNDRNPRSVHLIRTNVEANPGLKVEVTEGDLCAHLAEHHYDLVEVDPFGTPVPFLDAALRSARRGSVLGVTATDTAVLCGSKPEAAARRYLARVRHTDAYAEVGVRILVGYLVRMAARFDRGAEVLLAYAAEHFAKVHVRIAGGAARADAALARLGWVRFDHATGAHPALEEGAPGAIGPLWAGPLVDETLLPSLQPQVAMAHRTARLLERIRGEAALPPFYWDNNATARRAGVDPPPLTVILEALRALGHRAAPTHFRGNSFRTDAPPEELLRVYRKHAGG